MYEYTSCRCKSNSVRDCQCHRKERWRVRLVGLLAESTVLDDERGIVGKPRVVEGDARDHWEELGKEHILV